MPIISVLNPKGGSGKTTLSTNLARSLHERGFSVLIVDTDPQGSARDWHAANEKNPLPLVAMDRPETLKSLSRVAASYDYTIVDGAAKLEDLSAAALVNSDAVLIPVQPSPYDIWAMSDLVEKIKVRQTLTDGKPRAAFIVSRAIQKTKLSGEVGAALDDCGLARFKTFIVQRQIYPQSAAEGLSVFDTPHAQALTEINSLTDETIQLLSGGFEHGTISETA